MRTDILARCRKALGQVLAEGREKRRLRRELDECDQRGELDAVLADLGIARGQPAAVDRQLRALPAPSCRDDRQAWH